MAKTKQTPAMSLDALRQSRKVTQVEMAKRLEIGQGAVSRIEGRDDVKVSTLRDYVAGLGGALVLQAVFNGKAVTIHLD